MTSVGDNTDAGAVAFGGPQQTAPATLEDSMAESIVRLENELEEAIARLEEVK